MTGAVLFDLDGTLADTAPDLAHAVNLVRQERDLPFLPLATLRPVASHGARGLLRVGLGLSPEDPDFAPCRTRFLDLYAQHIARETALFHGMADVLQQLEANGVPWGVVTNKPEFLTHPLLAALGLAERAAAIVCGDTLAKPKPDPMTVHAAAERAGACPTRSLMIGDDRRDVQAAHGAGAKAWAASWGYIEDHDNPKDWQAERILGTVAELHHALAEDGWLS